MALQMVVPKDDQWAALKVPLRVGEREQPRDASRVCQSVVSLEWQWAAAMAGQRADWRGASRVGRSDAGKVAHWVALKAE